MSCFVMVRRASGSVAARPYSACRSSILFRSAPFPPPPARLRGGTLFRALFVPFSPPGRPEGGTLIRAYPARAPARVGAGAVRAPDCACTRPREGEGLGAPVPSPSRAFFAPPRTDAASGYRFLPAYTGKMFL